MHAAGLFKIPSVPSTGTLGTGTSGTTLGGGATTGDDDDGGEEEQQQPEEPSVGGLLNFKAPCIDVRCWGVAGDALLHT